jgi:hypothetical protein
MRQHDRSWTGRQRDARDSGNSERVDRIDLAAGGAQAGDQQFATGLDRDRDLLAGMVAVFSEQIDQSLPAGDVIADAAACDELAVGVHQGDIMVLLRPVDTACHLQLPCSFRGSVQFRAVQGHATP